MNFKKCFVFLLIALVVLPLIPFSLFAAGDPVLSYEVLVDGVDITEAEPGDIVTVTLYLQRTDKDEPFTMYAMQSELRYDSSVFELVPDSVHLYNGVNSTDIAVGGVFREFYMNFVSLTGGVEWQARTRVGSFQLRVIGTSGVSTITNEDYLVSSPTGTGGYECKSNDATVVMTTEFMVKFQSNGGSRVNSVIAVYGEKLARPTDPVLEGKVFAGWYKDPHLTEKWNFATDVVKSSMTLYAKWTDPASPPDDTTAPDETTTAPEVTTAPPEVTTAPPEVTTAPPEVTTAPPEVTTAPPEITTAPPEVTTAPPEVTTAPPEVTTAPPEVTTAPPVVTTAPPEVTTVPPVVTTEPPVVTTEPETTVPETTVEPEITTESETTLEPDVTTDPIVTPEDDDCAICGNREPVLFGLCPLCLLIVIALILLVAAVGYAIYSKSKLEEEE